MALSDGRVYAYGMPARTVTRLRTTGQAGSVPPGAPIVGSRAAAAVTAAATNRLDGEGHVLRFRCALLRAEPDAVDGTPVAIGRRSAGGGYWV